MSKRTCVLDDCDSPYYSKDYCRRHYDRIRATGDPNLKPREPKPVVECAVDDCTNTGLLWRGWCAKHYARWKKSGDPLLIKGRAPWTPARCSVGGCDRDSDSKGYCATHYARYRRTGSPGAEIKGRHRDTWESSPDRATCWSCGEEKAADDFHWQSTNPTSPLYGRREHRCKNCMNSISAAWRDANRALYNERGAVAQMKSLYGISPAQYQALLSAQGGGCAICGAVPVPGKPRLHIDHDHETGAIRGVLCHGCNTSIGLFREDARLLANAAAYLERTAA